ncbi:MAG: hypothetical protein L6V81_00495 [Clostridium sp.]|nr:MAG: hypothetical protein L6V81_00495 [Clostridium sp.]
MKDEEEKDIFESIKEDSHEEDLFESLKADTKEDIIDENKPLIKQIDVPNVMTYDKVIDEYEDSEESNAVISTEELEKVTKDRMDTLGLNDNQAAIAKYEEEQEKKAIISYEQLLKNASNITLSYKKENNEKGLSKKINKIEVKEKEVTQAISYLEEEEFLKKYLKSLDCRYNENIFLIKKHLDAKLILMKVNL